MVLGVNTVTNAATVPFVDFTFDKTQTWTDGTGKVHGIPDQFQINAGKACLMTSMSVLTQTPQINYCHVFVQLQVSLRLRPPNPPFLFSPSMMWWTIRFQP